MVTLMVSVISGAEGEVDGHDGRTTGRAHDEEVPVDRPGLGR